MANEADFDVWQLPVMDEVQRAMSYWSREHIAVWLHSTSNFLGGLRPLDVIENDPSRVVASARDAVVNEINPP